MVDYVYLRKHGYGSRKEDDAWKMDGVEVRLYGPEGQRRIFRKEEDLWLATEHGLQVWLREWRDG